MQFIQSKEKISHLLCFSKATLRSLEKKEETLNANIKYWLNKGDLVSLKKGLYLFKNRFEKEAQKDLYLEYLSGKIIEPSYLSLEYVMAKYQLLSEPVNTVTAITPKATRQVINSLANFRYYSIAKNLFTGYSLKYFRGASFFEAKKTKAVFDFLYLRFVRNGIVNEKAISDLRINWELISKKEFKEIISFAKLTKNTSVKKALTLINNKYYVNSHS